MWLDCEYILKADRTRFTGGVNVRYGRKTEVKDDSKVFGLSNWKNGVAMNESGKECSLSRFRAGIGRKKKSRFSF